MLEIVEAIDGREPLFRCTEIHQRSPLTQGPAMYHVPCGIHIAMAHAEKAWRDALRTQTVADIVAHYQQNTGEQRLQESAEWIAGKMRQI